MILVQQFRGGLVFKAHRLCVSLNSRLESNKEEEKVDLRKVPRGDRREFRSQAVEVPPCHRDHFSTTALRHGSLNSLLVALYLPS